MKTLALITISFFLFTFSCDKMMETEYYIRVNNQSDRDIFVTAGYGRFEMNPYPDTILPDKKPYLLLVRKNNYNDLLSPFNWEKVIHELPSDTLSIYVFSSDTVKAYDWSKIKAGYKILKRYDLSIEDLKKNNWTITYP